MNNDISLDQLLNKESSAIKNLDSALSSQGWAFVTLPDTFVTYVSSCASELNDYFTGTTTTDKLKFSESFNASTAETTDKYDGNVLGYYKAEGHKEGLRVLTGGRLKEKWMDVKIREKVKKLAVELDTMLVQLLQATAQPIFRVSYEELSKQVPIIANTINSPTNFSTENFAMLDVAFYTHDDRKIFPLEKEDQISVYPHYDPGILSLSIFSSQKGLQLKDSTDQWIDKPLSNNVGVLWAGEQASTISNGHVRPGWHRVMFYPEKDVSAPTPRLSIWIEACGAQQDLEKSFGDFKAVKDVILSFPSISVPEDSNNSNNNGNNTSNNSNNGTIITQNKNAKKPERVKLDQIIIKKGETIEKALSTIARLYRLPRSKVKLNFCHLCLTKTNKLLEHVLENHKDQLIYEDKIDTANNTNNL